MFCFTYNRIENHPVLQMTVTVAHGVHLDSVAVADRQVDAVLVLPQLQGGGQAVAAFTFAGESVLGLRALLVAPHIHKP